MAEVRLTAEGIKKYEERLEYLKQPAARKLRSRLRSPALLAT